MCKFEEIIKSGKPIEEINKELKEVGANFHLNPDCSKSGWTEKEMEEGFVPSETEADDVKHLHDYMKHNAKMAGKTEIYLVVEGKYAITWDENGHPTKAIRQN